MRVTEHSAYAHFTVTRDDNYRLHFRSHELHPNEVLVAAWTAARGKGLTSAGGKLVLTSERLLFEPMRTPKDALLGPVMSLLGAGEVGSVVKAGIDATGSLEQWAAPLETIAAVDGVGQEARVRVTLVSGESWEFEVVPGQWALRGSSEALSTRDEAVVAIRAALGRPTPPPAPEPSNLSRSGSPPADKVDLEQYRRQAVSSGQAAVVYEDGPSRLYFAPDGSFRWAFGYPQHRPSEATQPPNLVGAWKASTSDADGEAALLHANGSVTGAVQLFGALPPLAMQSGQWWWVPATSSLTVTFALEVPEFEDLGRAVFEFGFTLRLTYIGRDVVVGEVSVDGEESEEVTIQRVKPAAPGG